MSKKPYGSGYFGKWIEDEFGLPAYLYTCNQTIDPKAATPVNKVWRTPTDHLHQIGNDRLVGVASNYGYVQVRQDEGSPKFLNDYDPKRAQYAGGFGYLTDGREVLSTLYTGSVKEEFERIFGIGYVRKVVKGRSYTVDQIIFAPFGDDPLMISQVTVTNNCNIPADLRWVEYWGCQMYQFSFRSLSIARFKKDLNSCPELRRRFGQRFIHNFSKVDGRGLIDEKEFIGRSKEDRKNYLVMKMVATLGGQLSLLRKLNPVSEALVEDLAPPATFLSSVDAPADGMYTDAKKFFGDGGAKNPDGIKKPLSMNLSDVGSESGMFVERKLCLKPGQSKTLYFAYGYLPKGFKFKSLLSKYRKDLSQLLQRSCAAWKEYGIKLNISDEPWVGREVMWHNYYLRSALTYDSFFKEHILSQGGVYQYIFGFQGGARDPLQHALPFIFTQPEIIKEVIRYTLKEVQSDGKIPFGIVGSGTVMPAPFCPSDLQLWLLWIASEYVLATRDTEFLEEMIPTYPVYGRKASKKKVEDILKLCYHYTVEKIGVGEHGLMRLSNGDWNDGIVLEFVTKPKDRKAIRKYAESVLNASMASYVLKLYSHMLTYMGDTELAKDSYKYAVAQRKAVEAQWAGSWFRRAWLTPKLGWVGEKEMWLEPQPWAIISKAATQKQKDILTGSIDKLVRRPSKIGARLHSSPVRKSEIGMMTNAGIWPSINGTLIWALSLVDEKMGWDEWKKNSLAMHAEAYPCQWIGVWSGPDTYNSDLSLYEGGTQFDESIISGKPSSFIESLAGGINWTDFPVMNLHPHAWPLYSLAKIIGVEFTSDGVKLAPRLPKNEYKFSSPLLGLERSAEGYKGWYAPVVAGEWNIKLYLDHNEQSMFSYAEVNGMRQSLNLATDGAFQFTGKSESGKPLLWVIR